MAVSSSTWIVLWLVGAKIFQECEYPYQGWTYFDGFYFAFTALTTVGYGDLTPVSNSAKAFFVFWSLLALPTMTVLISNAGDTIVKGVKDGTLLLGNVTILPGEHGFRKSTKQVLAKLSCGVLFDGDDDIEEDVPGFLGAARERRDDTDDEDGDDGVDEPRTSDIDNLESNRAARKDAEKGETADPIPSTKKTAATRQETNASTSTPPKSPGRAASIARESLPTELPKTRAEYHLILMDEISRVTQHLRHSPPRKYTFKEWSVIPSHSRLHPLFSPSPFPLISSSPDSYPRLRKPMSVPKNAKECKSTHNASFLPFSSYPISSHVHCDLW